MATIKQEFDYSGLPSVKPYLDYLLEKGQQSMLLLGGVRVIAKSSLLRVKSINIREDMTLIRT